jgi:hypothetical protein
LGKEKKAWNVLAVSIAVIKAVLIVTHIARLLLVQNPAPGRIGTPAGALCLSSEVEVDQSNEIVTFTHVEKTLKSRYFWAELRDGKITSFVTEISMINEHPLEFQDFVKALVAEMIPVKVLERMEKGEKDLGDGYA